MKYIRKYNEELNFKTYAKTANKLKKMGHIDRSKALFDWAIEKNWIEAKERYSPFGKFKINLKNHKLVTDEFELVLALDHAFEDEIYFLKKGEEIYLSFFIGIIPLSKKTIEKCEEILEEDMDNGFYLESFASFTIKKEDCKIKIIKFSIDSCSYDTVFSFADRASAAKFKNLMIKLLSDPNFNYPYTNYKYLETELLIKYGLSADYGFELEDLAKYLKTISPNTLYKTL